MSKGDPPSVKEIVLEKGPLADAIQVGIDEKRAMSIMLPSGRILVLWGHEVVSNDPLVIILKN